MRTAVIALALVMGSSVAIAHELDGERTVSAKQIELANDLPKTTVIRVNKATKKIEVVHLKEHLQPGTEVNFEQLALKSETTQIAMNANNELDVASSTSSWSFGYVRGPWGGSAGYVRGPYGSAGYVRGPYGNGFAYANRYNGYYRPPYYGNYRPYNYGYGYNNCYNNYNQCGYYGSETVYASAWAYPTYNYGGYAYNYTPYYGYSDTQYDYAYCNNSYVY